MDERLRTELVREIREFLEEAWAREDAAAPGGDLVETKVRAREELLREDL